ncbi:MAG: M48 family metalloprotease [Succinivibrionaceae bacterium]
MFVKRFVYSVLGASLLCLCGCTVSGEKGNGKDFTYNQMNQLTNIYYTEFLSKREIIDNQKKARIAEQCVIHDLTRTIGQTYAGLRSEWTVVLTRDCSLNLALLNNGVLLSSNCSVSLLDNQNELAYVIAHSMAHSLLEHDNLRISKILDGKDPFSKSQKFNFKVYLRENNNEGYNNLTKAFGLHDSEGVVIPYDASQEIQADKLALFMMAKAGYNPNAALLFHSKNQRNITEKNSSYMMLHHHSDAEMKILSGFVEEALPIYKVSRNEYGRIPKCL